MKCRKKFGDFFFGFFSVVVVEVAVPLDLAAS